MGLYNDNSYTNRHHWEYTYKGSELLSAARRKYTEFAVREKEAREKMAGFMMNMSMTQSDGRIGECKGEIEKAGTEREGCMVWLHEFTRNPEKEYKLELGDVTYFDLALEPEA
jgi:hypothetical protein